MAGEGAELRLGSGNNGISTPAILLDVVHFNYPWVLLLVFLASFVTNTIVTAQPSSTSVEPTVTGPGGKPLPRSAKKAKEEREKLKLQDFDHSRKRIFLYLSAGLILTFFASAANIILHALEPGSGWWCGEATIIYVFASAFFWSIFLISLLDTTPSPSIAHQITWTLALLAEILLFGATLALYGGNQDDVNSFRKHNRESDEQEPEWEIIDITIDVVRVIILMFLVAFYIFFTLERSHKSYKLRGGRWGSGESEETTPLLANGHAPGNGHARGGGSYESITTSNGYAEAGIGETAATTSTDFLANGITVEVNGHVVDANGVPTGANGHAGLGRKSVDEAPAFYKPTTAPNKTWWEYIRGYSLFFPYLWPSKSLKLKIVVLVCFGLAILQRIVNIAVPLQMGIVVNDLSTQSHHVWLSISLFIVFKFLQGTSGLLGAARSFLWIPISQYSYQALTTASFEHVHGLSLDFHLGKRTGEVLSALSKGNAINNFLEQITFQVIPMIFDLVVAIMYFGIKFDAYYALVVSIITFSYLYLTIRMARWRSEQRRQMTTLSREEDAVKNDSLTSYETVKYFNAEAYEFNRYRSAVAAFQKQESEVLKSLNILNISQSMVFMLGLLATSFIAAYQVTTGKRDVGDYVSLMTYMVQLQQPLNFFGSFYRGVQSAMISGERLLELFKEQPTVVDDANAMPMHTCEGEIRFDNVKFSYDERKPALENLSFTCRPGTTTAFVGESGGGKSTVFRLLFRFYNTQDGSIQLDGNDIKDLTIDSVRRHIGVVPQDTVLFNETLMYNLQYANPDCTDADVYAACRAASIHDKIMAFPDGYQTKVGERGLRLSGGEKQRVAIARTILKNPRIIMLDEATAALDSDTEQNIQEALMTLSEGRTMLLIAHRLSTVTNADQILVLHAGKVAEAGTHEELLALKGRYANMWRKQIRAERAAEAASQMVAKANALQAAVMDREGGPSEDVSENEGESRNGTVVAPNVASKSAQTGETLQDGESTLHGSQAGDSIEDKCDDPREGLDRDKDDQEERLGNSSTDSAKSSEGESTPRP